VTEDDQLALFESPAASPTAEAGGGRPSGRGRARETFTRTVTFEVKVVDEAALRAAALRAFDKGVTIDLGAFPMDFGAGGVIRPAGEDQGEDRPEPEETEDDIRAEIADDAAAALDWLIEPTAGLRDLLAADALRIISVDLSIDDPDPHEDAHYRVGLAVMVKLMDPPAFREIALAACPDDDPAARTDIGESLAAAWNRAADPSAPLRDVPGVTWTCREVTVEQILARDRA
jgi:hypothetical protein